MSKKRKRYSPEEKAKVVLEILREENTLNEISIWCKPSVDQ